VVGYTSGMPGVAKWYAKDLKRITIFMSLYPSLLLAAELGANVILRFKSLIINNY